MNGGRIPWNVTAICEMLRIFHLMVKTPYERRFGIPKNGQVIPFGQWPKDQSRLHQFGPKVLPGIFLGYAFNAGRIWKGDILVADIEELEQMDASEIYARSLNAKESVNAHERMKNSYFQSKMEPSKPLEEIRF